MSKPIILFVDDKPVTHAFFRDIMDKSTTYTNYEILLALDLADAVEILESDSNITFKAVIIDLHLPGEIPEQLKNKYENKYNGHIQLNEGQVLGMYLHERNIPYMYLSGFSQKYKPQLEPISINSLDKDCDWDVFEKSILNLLNPPTMTNS